MNAVLGELGDIGAHIGKHGACGRLLKQGLSKFCRKLLDSLLVCQEIRSLHVSALRRSYCQPGGYNAGRNMITHSDSKVKAR